jgi:hypothetical protein
MYRRSTGIRQEVLPVRIAVLVATESDEAEADERKEDVRRDVDSAHPARIARAQKYDGVRPNELQREKWCKEWRLLEVIGSSFRCR